MSTAAIMRARWIAGVAAVVVSAGFFMAGALGGTARAAISRTGGNPWVFQQTNQTAEGLRINGSGGPNGQLLIVYDRLNQPIFWVNKDGGAFVGGDNISVMDGYDIFNPRVRLSPHYPDPDVCVRKGQLWIGGPRGRIYRCSDPDGDGPRGYRWRDVGV